MTKELSKKRDWNKEVIEVFESWSRDVRKGAENLSKLIVDAIDEDPANREVLYDALKKKGMSLMMFRELESVGRKTMAARLLIDGCGPHMTKIKKLPKDLQEKVLDGCMFEYLTADGSHMMVCARDCEDWQAKQMYADNGVRNLPEQKAWIEAEKSRRKLKEVVHTIPFEIKEKVVLFQVCSLTHEQVRQLALQLR